VFFTWFVSENQALIKTRTHPFCYNTLMPLENTSIPDREGAALYVVSSPDTVTHEKLDRLCADVRANCTNQVMLFDPNDNDARTVCDFYDVLPEQLPVGMIVRDDDTLVELWYGDDIPFNPSDIAFRLTQVSS